MGRQGGGKLKWEAEIRSTWPSCVRLVFLVQQAFPVGRVPV